MEGDIINASINQLILSRLQCVQVSECHIVWHLHHLISLGCWLCRRRQLVCVIRSEYYTSCLCTLQSIRKWNYFVPRYICIWLIKRLISPWELKWHSVGAAEQVIHKETPIRIIIHCPAIASLSVTWCLNHSLFLYLHLYPPHLCELEVQQKWEGEPLGCWGGGGAAWRGKKAVAWHHSAYFSSDLPFSAPLGMTLKNKILTYKMTKSMRRRVRWAQEERWERRQERKRENKKVMVFDYPAYAHLIPLHQHYWCVNT